MILVYRLKGRSRRWLAYRSSEKSTRTYDLVGMVIVSVAKVDINSAWVSRNHEERKTNRKHARAMMIVAMGWKEDWNDIAFFRRAFQKFRSVKPRNIEINFRIPTRLGLQIYRWCHARHDTKVGFRFIRFSKLSYVQRKSFTRHLLNLVPSIVTLRYYIFGPPQAPKNSKFIFFSQFGSIF